MGSHHVRNWRARKGLSLVELLASIAVLVILVAILVPVVRGMISRTEQVECVSNLRQIGMMLNLYLSDHDHWLPVSYSSTERKFWHQALTEYYEGDEATIFVCPSNSLNWGDNGGIFTGNYAWNITIGREDHPFKWMDFEDESKVCAVVDATSGYYQAPRGTPWISWGRPDFAGLYHNNETEANMLFLDGHVESVAADKVLGYLKPEVRE